MRTRLLAVCLGALIAVPAAARDYSGKAPMPTDPQLREIAGLFDRWNAALATGNPDKVTALYAHNGVLLPTVSNEVRVGPEAIRRYFVDFLQAKPAGTINHRELRMIDADTAMDAGVYTFTLTKNGKPTQVQARYSYVYEMVDGQWKILHHHSSAMPEPVGKRTASR